MNRRGIPTNPRELDPNAPYDVRTADLRGLRFGTSIRVSSAGQEDNGSRDLQRRRVRAFAREHGLVDSGLVWERVQSGKLMHTAQATSEQIAAARSRSINVLIFYDSSRYARNLKGALAVEDELHAAGCFVIYLDKGEALIASNLATRATKNQRHAENQEYIDRLGLRVAEGIEGQVLRGDDDNLELITQAGTAPFGWHRPNKLRAPLAHHDGEKPVVLEIAQRFLDPGETCATVAAWANEQGYATRRGNDWSKQSVYDLLTLPLHRGITGYHVSRRAIAAGHVDGMVGSIAPIISPELASRIDAKLAEGLRGRSKAVQASHHRRFVYVIAGLARWECGRKAVAQYGGSIPRPRYHHHGSHPHCEPERGSYAQDDYLRHLADFWDAFTLPDDVIQRVLVHLRREDESKGTDDGRELEIARLEARLRAKAAEFAQPDSIVTELELGRLKRETHDRIAELRQIQGDGTRLAVDLAAAADILRQLGSAWGDGSDESPEILAAQRDLMVAVFDEVVLWGPHVVSLRPRAPYADLLEAGAYERRPPIRSRIRLTGPLA